MIEMNYLVFMIYTLSCGALGWAGGYIFKRLRDEDATHKQSEPESHSEQQLREMMERKFPQLKDKEVKSKW